MLRIAKWALPALVLAAGCRDAPLGPADMRMLVATGALSLYVGEQTPIAAQVVREDGRVVDFATVRYWSEHPSVANVSSRGVVTGVTPGTTHVVAGYGAVQARVAVTVTPDDRRALHHLDIAAAEVFASTRNPQPVSVGFMARDGFGNSICDGVALEFRSDTAVARGSNGSTGPGDCRIRIQPHDWGETYVVASANGVSDSVLVKVTSTGFHVYFSESPLTYYQLPGSVARFAVTVEDGAGVPLAGRAVAFDVSGGTLDAYRVTTDHTGRAAVEWRAPTNVRSTGSRHTIEARTYFPDGSAGTASVQVGVTGGPPVTLQFLSYDRTNGWRPLAGTAHFAQSGLVRIYVVGRDEYGNLAGQPAARLTLSGTAPWTMSADSGCGFLVSPMLEPVPYSYCYSDIFGMAENRGTFRLLAQFPGMFQDTLRIVID